ncbi:hypothetical protein [Xanthomarina gelatinilytica]|uniref:hypothetical protein n=1 Tax=Xanthomarina gelatinilytica TaxID=1137281 RepID=UPI003AA99A09
MNTNYKLKSIINKGLLSVYGPLATFVVACSLTTYWITKYSLELDKADFITAIVTITSVMIGWIWWSYKIVKWKCWAFSQLTVDESYELYLKAIGVGLIWPTGSVFNKTEIWTKEDKYNWTKLKPEIQEIFEPEKKTE